MNSVELLKEILKGIGGVQMHFQHASIANFQGYTKLGKKMMEEYNEEMEMVTRFLNRIQELGGTLEPQSPVFPIYQNIEEMLREECKQQVKYMAHVENLIHSAEVDIVTEDLLTDYIKDETEHATWLKRQVALIEAIGIQNYLAKQI